MYAQITVVERNGELAAVHDNVEIRDIQIKKSGN